MRRCRWWYQGCEIGEVWALALEAKETIAWVLLEYKQVVALQVQIAWASIDSTGGGLCYGIGGCREKHGSKGQKGTTRMGKGISE